MVVTKVSRGILGPFFHMKMSMPSQHLCRCILGDAGHTRHLLHKGRHSNQELSAFHVPVSPKSFLCTQTLSSQYTDARAAYQELSLKAKAGLPPPLSSVQTRPHTEAGTVRSPSYNVYISHDLSCMFLPQAF